MRKVAVLSLIVLVALAGCGGTPANVDESPNANNTELTKVAQHPPENGVYTYADYQNEVVCYIFNNKQGYGGMGGISCLPFSEVEGYGDS